MRRYLVVAHKTLGGVELLDHLRELRSQDGSCSFHLIVPVTHPSDRSWTESSVTAEAEARLAEILEVLAEMGIGAKGEVGDVDPVYAVDQVLARDGSGPFAGVIIATLPLSLSRWWRLDAPSRLARHHPDLPVTHVVVDSAVVG